MDGTLWSERKQHFEIKKSHRICQGRNQVLKKSPETQGKKTRRIIHGGCSGQKAVSAFKTSMNSKKIFLSWVYVTQLGFKHPSKLGFERKNESQVTDENEQQSWQGLAHVSRRCKLLFVVICLSIHVWNGCVGRDILYMHKRALSRPFAPVCFM